MEVIFNEKEIELLRSLFIIDDELNNIAQNAVSFNDQYAIILSKKRWNDLMDSIYIEAKHEKKKRRQSNLDSLFIMIENKIYDDLD